MCNGQRCSDRTTSTINQMGYDSKSDSVTINVTCTGLYKEFQDKVKFRALLRDTLMRNTSRVKSSLCPRQTLLDITDIFLIDYLMHQVDRYDPSTFWNWGTSEGRYFAFDMGLSALPDMPSNCKTLLHCPPILCESIRRKQGHVKFTYTCDPIAHQNFTARMCWFNRNTIRKLECVSSKAHKRDRLDTKLKKSLEDEGFGMSVINNGYFGEYDFYQSLQKRVDYVLEYVDLCVKKFGNVYL